MAKKAGRPSKPILGLILAVAASCATAGTLLAQEAKASGTLTLNGSRIALKHAYATAEPGFFDKTTEDIHLLFSDVVLGDEDRASVFRLNRLAREGKANIVEVVLDASGEPISGAIYAVPFNGMASLAGMHRFDRRRLERTVVEGRMFMREASDFADVKFVYDVVFTVAIPRPPTPEEVAKALASPPGRLAAAYVSALHGGALEAFVSTLARNAAADYRGPLGPTKFADLRREMPSDAAVTGLAVQSASSARATIQGHENDRVIEYILSLVLEGGAWKVSK